MSALDGARPVLRLRPWATDSSDGTWPCGLCGDEFPVADSWHLTVRSRQQSTREIVCPSCASRLRHPAGKRGSPIRIAWGSLRSN